MRQIHPLFQYYGHRYEYSLVLCDLGNKRRPNFNNFREPIETVGNIIGYIKCYNRDRLHFSSGCESPMEYEKLYV